MDIRLPSLGEGADSGVVANIFVKEGDEIQKGQTVIELESEKAVASIPSPAEGRVTRVRVKQGDKISVGQVILSVAETVAAVAGAPPPGAVPTSVAALAERGGAVPAAQTPRFTSAATAEQPAAKVIPCLPVAASPSVRKLARDLGIDLATVRGSESGGRIGLADVRNHIARLQQLAAQPQIAAAPAKPAHEHIDFSQWGPTTKKPLSPLRRAIAHKMAASWSSVPRVTQFDEADITALNELKAKYDAAYEKNGTRLTLTPFVIKALITCLKKHQIFNSSLDEVAGEIVFKEYYHVGIAVDTEAGLIVPVLRDADKKSLLELSLELNALAEKTRARKISTDELKGGTFTISNQGGIGGGHFTPIVNTPEVAILGLGRGMLRPVIRNDAVVPRMILPVAVSYDHRVIDGGNAARFTREFCVALEQFSEAEVKL